MFLCTYVGVYVGVSLTDINKKYGVLSTDDTTTNVFYVIKFISEVYTLQNNTTIDGQVIPAGELVVK